MAVRGGLLTAVQPPLSSPAPAGYLPGREGWFDPSRRHLRYGARSWGPSPQQRVLAYLRDHVHPEIPRKYYRAVLGHDLHLSVWAELYVRQFHADAGWWEDIGRVSRDKITTAFRDFECLNLVTDSTAYGDFKYHEVGLSAAAEANTQTTLTTPTGIARVIGTQTNPSAFTYQSIAVVLADTTEVWQEHGLFNALAAGTMMDRSLLSPVVNVVAGDTFEVTYILTKSAEP
jgi:hypothetical protein